MQKNTKTVQKIYQREGMFGRACVCARVCVCVVFMFVCVVCGVCVCDVCVCVILGDGTA